MKRIPFFLLMLLPFIHACQSSPRENVFFRSWDTPYGTAPFSEIRNEDYLPAFQEGIARQREEIAAIISNPAAPDFENTIAAYDRSGELLAKVSGVFFNLSESVSTPEIQAIEEQVIPMVTAAEDEILMNAELFARVAAVYEQQMDQLSREQQMVTEKLYRAFVRNGVGLPAAAQERFKEINTRLSSLSQRFGNNLLAENNAFKEEIGVTVSQYSDYMTSCPDREAREKAFRAYSSRGNRGNANDNNGIALEIMKLRAEKAALLGYDTPAAYALADKMAGDAATVDAFLDRIMQASMAKAREEIRDMQAVMDEDIQAGLLPAGSRIQPWDWFYYAEKVRARKYNLDENLTKPYFQIDSVRKGVFVAAEKIYGIHVEEAPEVEVYHPAVRAFKLTDTDGSLLGIFYADYFSRESKRGGAWMNNFRDQYMKGTEDVRPIICNVCNFPPETESEPSLLTVDEVQTAFHEFGHALHGFLTRCHYRSISGTSVARDFVEMFSQFNENWAFQEAILSQYAHDYRSGEGIPAELVEKINRSLRFNQGFMTGELCAASILDMRWHELSREELEQFSDAQSIRDFEARVCAEMGLVEEMIPRYRTTYFNHIFNSGYSAGYYGYLWSEVLDVDAFERFKEEGLYNPAVARSFREIFLERGGSEEPMTLYRAFRGADPDPDALLRARGLI